jgi:hypothetical protein
MIIKPSLLIGVTWLVVSVASVLGATSSIEGIVKDAKNQPVKGADVRVESSDGKRLFSMVTTNPNGRYVSNALAAGTYRVTLLVNGAVKAVIKNAQTTPGRATQLNFALKPSSVSQVGPIGKRGRHMVWVPARTGSHVGGSWVEVDVNGKVGDDSPVETATGDQLRRQQLTQPIWSIKGQGGAGVPPTP